jgi:PAS domain S-box-containing protein
MLSSKIQIATPNAQSLTMNPDEYLGGYHRFCLEKPYHLEYASNNLCSLIGYTADEIHDLFHDQYNLIVYEEDRKNFLSFIRKLAAKEQTLTQQYRIVHKDGHIIYINDIITSRRSEDGKMYGFSVIADITGPHLRKCPDYFSPPQFKKNSYGLLQCTCEKYPKITYLNSRMQEYLNITGQSSEWLDLLKENIFFMVPFAARESYQKDLTDALKSTEPLSVEHQLLRSDGTPVTLTGWMSITENEYGKTSYTMLYVPSKKDGRQNQISGSTPYLRALKCAYHIIFQFNFQTNIVECIQGHKDAGISPLKDFKMPIEVGKNFWLDNYVMEEDRERMQILLSQISPHSEEWKNSPVKQLNFRIKWIDNVIHTFHGVAVQLDETAFLLCCRDITETKHNTAAEKPSVEVPSTETFTGPEIFARTFGHFDLFVHGTPVIFSSAKEKEIMALLIDRQGGTLSTKEAISYLWPDEKPSTTLTNRYHKLGTKLKNTLHSYGIEHIIINNHGIRSIDVSAITCDCYEMLAGNEAYSKNFCNSYMIDYSWGEATLAKLWNYTRSYA